MKIFPAIDLYDGKAVRLYKGDYAKMTVYSDDPPSVAAGFQTAGATCLHLVDLEGAKTGTPANTEAIRAVRQSFQGFIEVGGGIRSMQTIQEYLELGVDRVILGTAAVTDPAFLEEALQKWGQRIAVGVDLKDGFVAIQGWTEVSDLAADRFFARMTELGVKAVICTDISRDGAMQGTNRELYRDLTQKFPIELIASGGVSAIRDVQELVELGIDGAIIGKACYVGAIDLKEAIEVAR